jgi:hypothetical protein
MKRDDKQAITGHIERAAVGYTLALCPVATVRQAVETALEF